MFMTKTEPNFGPSGLSTVTFIGQQVQIIFDANNEVVNLPLAAMPTKVVIKALPKGKKLFVSVDGTRTRLTAFRPASGSPICKFIGFKLDRNEIIPMPKYPRKREGMTRAGLPYPKDWLEFTALAEVIDDLYTGCEIQCKLRYYFTAGPDGNTQIKGEGPHSVHLSRFLECAGSGQQIKIPFTDNILPPLQEYLLTDGRPFMIVMANGWPESFGEAPVVYQKKNKKPAAKKTAKKK